MSFAVDTSGYTADGLLNADSCYLWPGAAVTVTTLGRGMAAEGFVQRVTDSALWLWNQTDEFLMIPWTAVLGVNVTGTGWEEAR